MSLRTYELLFALPGTLTDAETAARAEQMVAMVKEISPSAELHTLGKNRLAYPIKQIRYGYFYTVVFGAESIDVKKLETRLPLQRDVLRFMVSHFNTTLTASQTIAYSNDGNGATMMVERAEPVSHRPAFEPAFAAAPTVKVIPKEELNLEDINKKLDDLMSGGIIPGV